MEKEIVHQKVLTMIEVTIRWKLFKDFFVEIVKKENGGSYFFLQNKKNRGCWQKILLKDLFDYLKKEYTKDSNHRQQILTPF